MRWWRAAHAPLLFLSAGCGPVLCIGPAAVPPSKNPPPNPPHSQGFALLGFPPPAPIRQPLSLGRPSPQAPAALLSVRRNRSTRWVHFSPHRSAQAPKHLAALAVSQCRAPVEFFCTP